MKEKKEKTMKNFPPKQTGVYRLRKGININELKFEVQLRLLNSMFPFSICSDKAKFKVNEKPQIFLKLTFGWQEKILSASEVALYRDANNCKTKIQKKYHKWVQESDRMQELLSNQSLMRNKEGRKRSTKRTVQMQQLMAERQANQIHMIYTYIDSDEFASKVTEACAASLSKKDLKYGACNNLEPYQHMFVYADLKPATELVHFLWDPNENQLFVYPDFCQSPEQFYYMEIISYSRHLYAYNLVNITNIQHRLRIRNKKNLRLSSSPRTSMRAKLAKLTFSKPARRSKRITLLLQLNTGENFEYDNIHVRYQMKLPDNTFLDSGLAEATTQSCYVTGGSQIAHFAYTWEVSIICEELFNPQDLLYIYFEVISIDSWGRERDEGYAVYSCQLLEPLEPLESLEPLHPKMQQLKELQCVRPLSNWRNALSRYFFGGRHKFDYIAYLTPSPNATGGNITKASIRRYNFPMQKTGQLTFTIYKIKQRYFPTYVDPSQRIRPLNMNFEDILRAYHEAQERLEEMIELRKKQEKEGYAKEFKFTFESL